jgi:hypothetical protein
MATQAQEAGSHSPKVGGFVTYDTIECPDTVSGQHLAANISPLTPLASRLASAGKPCKGTNTQWASWCCCKNMYALATGIYWHLCSHWDSRGFRPSVRPPTSPLVQTSSKTQISWLTRRVAHAWGAPRQQTTVEHCRALAQVQTTRSAPPAGRQPPPPARRPIPGSFSGKNLPRDFKPTRG